MTKKLLMIITIFLLFPMIVFASGDLRVSSTNLNITRGGGASFKITATNAAGRVNISTSNGSVASISTSSEWLDNSTITVTVRGLSVGNTTITVTSADMATYDSEVINKTFNINVNVTEPLASNTNLSRLEVEGYELVSVADNAYTLTVSNSKTSVNIIATAEDSKSSVTGAGVKELIVGENIVEIVVRAENGATKTYTITITRKNDNYYLEDIDDFVSSESNTILIHNNDTISSEVVTKLENINKDINFVNNENEVKYTYIIPSSKVTTDYNLNVSFSSQNDITKLSNYAIGKSVVTSKLPNDTDLKITLTGDLIGSEKINIYQYQDGELKYVKTVDVTNNEISFTASSETEYFITPSLITDAKIVETSTKSSFNFFIPISIVELIAIIILIVVLIITGKKKSSEPTITSSSISTNASPVLESSPSINSLPDNTFTPSPEPNMFSSPTINPVPESPSMNNIISPIAPIESVVPEPTPNIISTPTPETAIAPQVVESPTIEPIVIPPSPDNSVIEPTEFVKVTSDTEPDVSKETVINNSIVEGISASIEESISSTPLPIPVITEEPSPVIVSNQTVDI